MVEQIYHKFSMKLRLQELIEESGKTHKELSEILKINLHDIIRWDSGKNDYLPSIKKLMIFADYFQCSVDYLLGLTDLDSYIPSSVKEPKIAGNLRKIVYERNLTFTSLSEKTGIKNTTLFYNWNSGKSLPQIENLIKVASALDCSVDFLLGRET